MVTTLTVITYLRSLDTYKSSNTDETSIVETTFGSLLQNNTIMEIIHDVTILIILGITLQYIETIIVHKEK